jgi:flagellar protein FliT
MISVMPAQIEIYRQMSALSAEMVAAAQAQEWDRLVALEQVVSSLRNTLISEGDGADLPAEERNLKAALIQRILDDDAEIRRHTEPWMEHVRQFLDSANNQRRIETAYGATGGFSNSFL